MSHHGVPLRRLGSLAAHLHSQADSPSPPVSAAPTSAAAMSARELYQLDTLGFLKVEGCIDKATCVEAYSRSDDMIEAYGELIHQDAGYGDKYRNAFLCECHSCCLTCLSAAWVDCA